MGAGQRTVTVRLAADASKYIAEVGGKAVRRRRISTPNGRAWQGRQGQVQPARGHGRVAGAGLVGAFGFMAKAAMDFDKEMSAVAAVSDASGKTSQLRAAAMQAGKETAFSAMEAATAEEALRRPASPPPTSSVGRSPAPVAGRRRQHRPRRRGDDRRAGDGHVPAPRRRVAHIADVLAAGANKSATDVGQLGMSLKQAGPVRVADRAIPGRHGRHPECVAQAGLVGSDAGTSLKTMLQSLQSASGPAATTPHELGITPTTRRGNSSASRARRAAAGQAGWPEPGPA